MNCCWPPSRKAVNTSRRLTSRIRGSGPAVPLVAVYDDHERLWLPPAPVLFQRRVGSENRPDPCPHHPQAARRHPHPHRPDRPQRRATALRPPRFPQNVPHRRDHERAPAAHRPSDRRAPRHQRHPRLQGRLPPTKRSRPTWPSSPAARRCGLPRNTAPPPTPNGRNSSATSNAARSPPASAAARSAPPASTNAVLRCALHWPDPAQRPRIAEIRDNLIARIAEAEREGWLGEAEGLKISLAGAEDKLAQVDRRSRRTTDLGMPATVRKS
jgi:hypothetical protein